MIGVYGLRVRLSMRVSRRGIPPRKLRGPGTTSIKLEIIINGIPSYTKEVTPTERAGVGSGRRSKACVVKYAEELPLRMSGTRVV